jgi:succinate dehydrogenase / fumarate reductase membrane anchor subunit
LSQRQHWLAQRATALALVPLSLWLLVALVRVPLADHAAVCAWVGAGWHPVLLGLTLLAMAWHSRLGVQEIIEDYLHAPALKSAALWASSGGHVLLVVMGCYGVWRVAQRGAS